MKTNELNHKLYLYKPNGADSDFLGELLVDNLKVDIRLHDISNISFTMPRTINGVANPRIDQVLDNYIVELHYGRVGESYPDNYFKMRFVIYKTPLSFTDEKFLHNYEGASIESLLEFKSINNWPGVEVYDFFRTINYIRAANNFTEGSNTYANLESNSTTGQRYIRVEPNNVNPIFPLDIFLYEIRKNIVAGQPIETKNALIDFNFAGKDYTHPDFKVGFYYLDLNTDGSIEYIYIALPDNKASYENATKNYLYNTFTTNDTSFAYRLYDNPISKTFAVGPNTNEDTNPLSDMYITLSTNADVESGQSSFGGITYNFQKIYSKNGLTLRQILTGKTTPDDFPDISNIDGLLYDTGYTIGEIHEDIESLYRSNLQFNNITRYQALKQIAESFKSVIVFDTITKEVSFYPENEYGNHKGLILRYGSYLKSLNKDIDSTKIITAATSIGKDKTTISLVNPTGRSYWEDYAYFLDSYFINTDENDILDIINSNVLTLTTQNKTLKTAATINTGIQHTALKVLYSGSTGGFFNRWFSSASFAKVVGEWQFARDLYNEIMLGNIKPSVDIPSIPALAALDRYYDLYRIRDEKIKIFVKYDTQLAEYEASMYKSKYLFDFYKKKWDELTPDQQQTNRTNRTDLWLKFNKYGIEYQSAVRTIEDFDSFILRPIREDLFGSETLKEGPDNSILRKFLEVQSALHRQPNATEVINSATYTTSIYLIDLDVLDTFKRYGVNSDNNIDNEIELLKATKVYLLENKYPKVTVNIDLVSLISAEEAQQDWDKTFIGDKVLIYLPELNVDLDAQIREVSIDFEANSTSLVIATVRDYNRTFGRFLSKIVRKLNNSNDNITKYYQDQFNEGSNNATLNKIQRKEGQRLDETNKLFSGAQDSETGQSTTEFDGRGFQSAVIGEVDEATQTFKLVDAAEKGISNVDGALIAYYDRGAGGIRTEVEVSGDNGIVIRRIDNDTNETNKQMYIDAFGNAIFNGQLIVGGEVTAIDEFRSEILNTVGEDLELLQNQIDGSITTWFGEEDPDLQNFPTSEWNPSEYMNFVGDLFYNTATGGAFRFIYAGSTPETPDPEDFGWIVITDTAIAAALSAAAEAQATADKKVTIFYAANQTDLDKITPPSGSGPELAEDGDMVVIGGIFTHSVSNIKYNTFDTYRWDDNLIPKRWVKTQNIYDKAEGSVGGWTVGSTTISSNNSHVVLNNAGFIALKKPSYSDDNIAGAFLGMDGNTAKFNVGNNTRFLKWTGEELEVNGDIGGSIGQIAVGNNDIVISSTGITTASNNFSLSTGGILTAVDGNFSGTITANSGTIGGFTIGANVLTAGGNGQAVGISPNALNTGVSFYAGAATSSSNPPNQTQINQAPFRVTNTGQLYATKGEIGAVKLNNFGIDETITGTYTVGTDTLVDFTDNYYENYSSTNYQYNVSSVNRKYITFANSSQIKKVYLRINIVQTFGSPLSQLIAAYSLNGRIVRLITYSTTASNGSNVTFDISVDNVIDRIDIFTYSPWFAFTITFFSSQSTVPVNIYLAYKPYIEIEDTFSNKTARIYETGTMALEELQSDIASTRLMYATTIYSGSIYSYKNHDSDFPFAPRLEALASGTRSSPGDVTITAGYGNYSLYDWLYLEITRSDIQKSGVFFRISDIGGVNDTGPWYTLVTTQLTNSTSVSQVSIRRGSTSSDGNTFLLRYAGNSTSYTFTLYRVKNSI